MKPGSRRRIISYVVDWVLILLVAGLGGLLYHIRGNTHPFSLQDQTISYPLYPDTVTITVAGVVALVVPAIVIAALSLLLPPRGLTAGNSSAAIIWRRKLWEWNTAWLGLGLSVAGAFFVTSALKDVVGKPRPNFLARCEPDTTAEAIARYAVSGLGTNVTMQVPGAPTLVTVGICKNPDLGVVMDGFAAWPSGHSSFSWSGLLYFSLWLAMKLSIAMPGSAAVTDVGGKDRAQGAWGSSYWRSAGSTALRSQVAAPPVFLLTVVLIPIGAAMYICGSRWADNMHAGWDILAGSMIGIVFAWLGFRWYHPPLQNLFGMSWGPRSSATPFFGGPGTGGNVEEMYQRNGLMAHDVENGRV